MKKNSFAPDFLVGLFVLVGLLSIATLIIMLSGVTTADLGVTRITVKMENADGLIKGTKVMMSGVRIGRVSDHPALSPDGRRAVIQVAIQQPFQIRQGSNFVVKPEGILGDRFVDVIPPADPNAPPLKDGDVAEGSRMTGLGDLADSAKDLVSDIRPVLATIQDSGKRLDSILTRVDQDVLNEETAASIRATISKLGEAVEKLNSTLATADDTMSNAREATASAKSALDKVNREMLDEKTVADFKKVIADLSRTVSNLQSFIEDLKKGDGVIGRLATDKQLADDLAAFVANLRQRGILFYADVAGREQAREERAAQQPPQRPVAPAQGTRTQPRSAGGR